MKTRTFLIFFFAFIGILAIVIVCARYYHDNKNRAWVDFCNKRGFLINDDTGADKYLEAIEALEKKG